MDYSIIENLLKISKKSNAPKDKKEEFCDQYLELLKAEGYTEKSERYILEGFTFEGALPIAEFLVPLNSEERIKFLQTVMSGKRYKNNEKGFAFKFSVNILCRTLNLFPDDSSVIMALIKEIPKNAKNKEGKLYGDAEITIRNYFVKTFEPTKRLTPLYELQGNEHFTKNFRDFINTYISKMNSESSHPLGHLSELNKWLNPTPENISSNTVHATEKKPFGSQTSTVCQTGLPKESLGNKPCNKNECKINNVDDISDFFGNVEDYIKKMQSDNDLLKKNLEEYQKSSLKSNEEKEMLRRQNQSYKSKNSNLENDLATKINQLNNCEKQLKEYEGRNLELSKENATLQTIKNAYADDKRKSLEEQANQLALKLELEFSDFRDVENQNMTLELGENFRRQIQQIAKILKKSGIQI